MPVLIDSRRPPVPREPSIRLNMRFPNGNIIAIRVWNPPSVPAAEKTGQMTVIGREKMDSFSIGIIGGPDGPANLYLTGDPLAMILGTIAAAAVIARFIFLVFFQK